MLKFFAKGLIFAFLGIVLTSFYLLCVGYDFRVEEIKFEPLTGQPNRLQTMKGVSEIEWEGKRALSLIESGGTQNFGIPFLGLTEKSISLSGTRFYYERMAEILFLLLISSLVMMAFYKIFKVYNPLTLSFLGFALMTALFNNLIWEEPWSYGRATLGLLVFNLLIFTKERTKLNLFPMFLIPVIFLLSLFSMKLL